MPALTPGPVRGYYHLKLKPSITSYSTIFNHPINHSPSILLLSFSTMKYISSLLVCLTIGAVECRRSGTITQATRTKQLVPRGGGGGELQTSTQISTKKAVSLGCLLALNSGIVNGACLSGLLHPTKQASAAVTGECMLHGFDITYYLCTHKLTVLLMTGSSASISCHTQYIYV